MIFYIIRFIIVWLVWLILADKKRFKELIPVGIFAGFMGFTGDILGIPFFWEFPSPYKHLPTILTSWGMYIVITYLFLQWLPKKRNFRNLFLYWLIWILIAIGIEWLHIKTGHMKYHHGWNLGWSFLTNWLLYTLFYNFYKFFDFEKLRD